MMKRKILSFALALVMVAGLFAGLPMGADAFEVFSGYAYYHETYISSPDGLVVPDLESMYQVWKEGVKYAWSYNGQNSREDFLASIADNSRIYNNANKLSGLTFEQAAEKIAKEKSREFQFAARCAIGFELSGLEYLIYTLNIPDYSKLTDGKLRLNIDSLRNSEFMRSSSIEKLTLTKDGSEILPSTCSEGQLWSKYWDVDFDNSTTKNWMEDTRTKDSPMTAKRTYELLVDVGTNEFIIDDDYNTFKLIVTVGEVQEQPTKPTPTRVYGSSRIDTAIEASKVGRTSADNVVLAAGWNFPDALAGGPLAHMLDAPILLTKGTTTVLESTVLTRIQQLGAKNIYILGGEIAISSGIESQLKSAGYTVTRLSGADRYETSVAIAKKMDELRGTAPEFVFVSDGLGYADALAATPVAALKKVPIIFTPNNASGLRTASANYAEQCGAKKAVLIGGEVAVKSGVASKLAEMGFTTERVSGDDRYDTSAKIYLKYKDIFTSGKAVMATGRDFPDALAGGVLGGKLTAPLLLVNGTGTYSAPVKSAITALAPTDVYVLGGGNVVTDAVVNWHIG